MVGVHDLSFRRERGKATIWLRGPVIAVTLSALAVSACGSSSVASRRLTDQQWVAQANAVCTTLTTQTRALGPRPGRPGHGVTVAQALERSAAYLDRYLPLSVSAVARIRALGPRPQGNALVTDALTAADTLNSDLGKARTAGHAADERAYLAAIGLVKGTDGNRATATAKPAGLAVCAAS